MALSAILGGESTKPYVNKIMEVFPVATMKPGTTITYAQVLEIIGTDTSPYRFRTITNAWRKRISGESTIEISVRNKSFVVLDDKEKLTKSIGYIRSSARSVRKSVHINLKVNRNNLDESGRAELDFNRDRIAKITAIMQIKRPALLPEI